MKLYQFKITGVDCANCAAKIEDKIRKLSGVKEVNYHFMTQKLSFQCEESQVTRITEQMKQIVHQTEPDAKMIEIKSRHHHKDHNECHHEHHEEHCGCGHEHHEHHEEHCGCSHEHHEHHEEHCGCGHEHHEHHEEHCGCGHEHHKHHEEHCGCGHEHHKHHEEHCGCGHEYHEHYGELHQKYQFVIDGLDCANCAAKVERHLNKQEHLSDVEILFMTKTLKLNSSLSVHELKSYLEKKISEIEDGVTVHETAVKAEIKKESAFDSELMRILVSIVLFVFGLLMRDADVISLLFFASCYLCVGAEILLRAVRNIRKGQVFDENFLMAVATIGAIIVSEYAEACAVMVFYQIGEYFQNRAVEKSRRSISELMDIQSKEAHVLRDGKIVTVDPEDVHPQEIVAVYAGEKIPLDGIVVKGTAMLDARALTGESRLVSVQMEDEVPSGMINMDGLIHVRVLKPYHDSTVARILDLVENAGSRKAPAEAFITRFAKVYTPFVCFLAVCIAVLPPLVSGNEQWMEYLYRACTFLVVSCPCALVVSVPLSYFAAIGGLSGKGVLVKGGSYLDVLNQVDTFVFDKTGTLTRGNFEVTDVISEDPERTLALAAAAEKHSNHPIAKSIVNAVSHQHFEAEDVHEIAGKGIKCSVAGRKVLAGNHLLMEMHQIQVPEIQSAGTLIYIAEENQLIGTILIQDTIRSDAKQLIASLKALGKKTIMLTGDQREVAEEIAEQLNVDEVFAQLLPQDKVKEVEKLIAQRKTVAFAGDGINDAPVLAVSSVGFAMGGIGSDAAIEAADVVMMSDHLDGIMSAVKTAKKTRRIVLENIYGALLVKFVILLLSARGEVGMWAAVFADVGVAVLAILNAIRAMKKV